MMVLSFTITPQDYSAFCRYQYTRRRSIQKLLTTGLLYALIASASFFLFYFRFSSSSTLDDTISFFFIVCLVAVFISIFIGTILFDIGVAEYRVRRKSKSEQILVELSTEGLRVQHTKGEFLTKWTAICKIVQTQQYIYFYFNEMSAFIVPKDAFRTSQDREAFSQSANQFYTTAKDVSV